jgi:hypothetical protein
MQLPVGDSGPSLRLSLERAQVCAPDTLQPLSEQAPLCPTHGLPMVVQTARQGQRFYGCPQYPQCKEKMAID